ncbi:MAG: nucleotidyltransferase family protein [Leptolyngbyaceae cyanobacterium]
MQHLQSQLADLLFGEAAAVNAAAATIAADNRWRDLLELSFQWRVTPQLWQRLQSVKPGLPAEVRQEFSRLCRVIAVQSTTAAHRSVKVMQALEAVGIKAVAFKGIGVMASLYAKPSDRMVGDVDILIEPEALPAVFEALQPLGFTPVLPGELKDYLEYLEHRTRADNLFLIFKDTSGFEVDLHWGLKATAGVEFSVAGILERGETVTLLQQPIPVASPVDAMLLSVHHSVRDDLAPASAIKDLCDLQQWWMNRDRWQPDAVMQQAEKTGLLPALIALWQVLAGYDATHPAQAELGSLERELSPAIASQAQSLQTLFTLQLQGEDLNRDLVNGLNWSTVVRFIRRRLQKGNTLTFDKSLWGINHGGKFNLSKIRRLFQTLQGLDRKKLDAYKALSNLQDR